MLRFKNPSPYRAHVDAERLQWKEDTRLMLPECREKLKGIGRVAVVGGGLAGLMAARQLVQFGVKVTVYEARKEVGGRVLSNTTFSAGRVTEEGAELIGSFHTKWLELAREFGLAMISRMDSELYNLEGLEEQIILDKRLSKDDIDKLTGDMYSRVLTPLALLAAREIQRPSEPWLQRHLIEFDKMSVQEALPRCCKISERYKDTADEPLWQMLEFKLVNDEVAPLDEMNFLSLLCKVRAGQGDRMNPALPGLRDGYWDELEIFRCADGCQTLATKIAEKIQTKKYGPEPAAVRRLVAVTHINISKMGVTLGLKATRPDGKFVDDKAPLLSPGFSYVILAIPPSVWPRVTITAYGKDADPAKEIGQMRMNDAVKYFSDVKERFWIKKRAAPYGGSLRLGQVWEGTDNQTWVSKQGIVLSVFAGPISASRRAPTRDQCRTGLSDLYPGDYLNSLTKKPLFSDWPNVPFIKTGYWSPVPGEIFKVGEKLSKPFHDRLFFAGEHTQMDFFGYMEGALRSGERAADTLLRQTCGLADEPEAKLAGRSEQAPARKPSVPEVVARAAPTREATTFLREREVPLGQPPSTSHTLTAESPFLDQAVFKHSFAEEFEPRAAALVVQSPFAGALDDRPSSFHEEGLNEEWAPEEVEEPEELAVGDWDEVQEEQLWEPDVQERPAREPGEAEVGQAELGDRLFEVEDYPDPLAEELVASVPDAELRKRIDEYFDLANAEYFLPGGATVNARPQFHMADPGSERNAEELEKLLKNKLGSRLASSLHTVIRCAAYGRARPQEIKLVTQHLIDAGEWDAVRSDNPTLADAELVRALQLKFNIGIDCAGYVQLEFIFAFTKKHDDAKCNLSASKLRHGLGLKDKRSEENLAYLPTTHFTEVGFLNAKTGDLFILSPRQGERDWHTVIVVDHTETNDVHTFTVDASWGHLYGDEAAGVQRRELLFDRKTGMWWDVIGGRNMNANPIGPYSKHTIKGMYRAKVKR
jgi:monoamine oxidase